MVSGLVPGASSPGWSPGRGHYVVFLGKILTLTVPLSVPRSIKGYRQIVGENLTNCGGMTCDGLASRPGGVEILLAVSCHTKSEIS